MRLAAAVAAQRRLDEQVWPEGATVRVRMGIHTPMGVRLINRLREKFELEGTPIRLHVRRREKKGPKE